MTEHKKEGNKTEIKEKKMRNKQEKTPRKKDEKLNMGKQ